MDFVSPLLDVVSRICNCVGDRSDHHRRLPQNLNSLRYETEKLNNVYEELKERVEREENLEKKKRTQEMSGNLLSQKLSRQLQTCENGTGRTQTPVYDTGTWKI